MFRKCIFFMWCLGAALGISDEIKEFIEQLHNTCKDEVNIAEEILQATRQGVFADDNGLRCYFKCIMTNTAIMNEEGVIDVEAAVAMLPEEMQGNGIPETIRRCTTQAGTDKCDTAYRTYKCYYDDNPTNFFLI